MVLITTEKNTSPTVGYCFLCGELVENVPYIFWEGCNGKAISLHPECAEYLGINILSDFLAYQYPRLRECQNVST